MQISVKLTPDEVLQILGRYAQRLITRITGTNTLHNPKIIGDLGELEIRFNAKPDEPSEKDY